MSTMVSGSIIRTAVQTRLGYPSFTAAGGTTIAQVNAFIVDSATDLAARIRSEDFGDDFFTVTATVAVDSTVPYIDVDELGDAFLDVRKVAWLRNSDQSPIPIPRATIDDTFRYGIENKSWDSASPVYRLVKDRINFYPNPATTCVVMVSFDTDIGLESDLSNVVDLWPGWKEWITYDTCAKILEKENKLEKAGFFGRERDRVWEQICRANANRDDWRPLQVRDTRDGASFPGDWPRRS